MSDKSLTGRVTSYAIGKYVEGLANGLAWQGKYDLFPLAVEMGSEAERSLTEEFEGRVWSLELGKKKNSKGYYCYDGLSGEATENLKRMFRSANGIDVGRLARKINEIGKRAKQSDIVAMVRDIYVSEYYNKKVSGLRTMAGATRYFVEKVIGKSFDITERVGAVMKRRKCRKDEMWVFKGILNMK